MGTVQTLVWLTIPKHDGLSVLCTTCSDAAAASKPSVGCPSHAVIDPTSVCLELDSLTPPVAAAVALPVA
jgi:hypothetical protein